MPNDNVNGLINERQWVNVLFCCYFELLEINTNFQLPILFGTTTIGDIQVAFSTSLMKPTTINMFMSCLTIVALLIFNQYLA
jgi:hypothetical protein